MSAVEIFANLLIAEISSAFRNVSSQAHRRVTVRGVLECHLPAGGISLFDSQQTGTILDDGELLS
jgi:hypothetical protein